MAIVKSEESDVCFDNFGIDLMVLDFRGEFEIWIGKFHQMQRFMEKLPKLNQTIGTQWNMGL